MGTREGETSLTSVHCLRPLTWHTNALRQTALSSTGSLWTGKGTGAANMFSRMGAVFEASGDTGGYSAPGFTYGLMGERSLVSSKAVNSSASYGIGRGPPRRRASCLAHLASLDPELPLKSRRVSTASAIDMPTLAHRPTEAHLVYMLLTEIPEPATPLAGHLLLAWGDMTSSSDAKVEASLAWH